MKKLIVLIFILLPLISFGQSKYKIYYGDNTVSFYQSETKSTNLDSFTVTKYMSIPQKKHSYPIMGSDTTFTYLLDSTIHKVYRFTRCCCDDLSQVTSHQHNCYTSYYSLTYGNLITQSLTGDVSILINFNGIPISEKLIEKIISNNGFLMMKSRKKLIKDYKKCRLTEGEK